MSQGSPFRLAAAAGLVLATGLVVTACGYDAGASPSGGGGIASPAPSAPPPTAVPGASGATGATAPTAPSGGGTDGNPGTGILDPGSIGGIFDPAPGPAGEPTLVKVTANVRDIRDVNASKLEAAVNGTRVAVRVSWTSGVEPCYALAGIDVARDGMTITLTVREGSAAAPDTMCTEQAMLKAAVVDLGDLATGTWTIMATGDAEPIEVVVAG